MWSAILGHAKIRVNPRQVPLASLFTLSREGPASDEVHLTNFTNQPRTEVAPASLPASNEEEFANSTQNDREPTN